LLESIARWTFWGACSAAVAAFLNLFVDVAELNGRTVFGGVDLQQVWRFATTTTVGQLSLLRVAALVAIALASRFRSASKWGLILAAALSAAVCEGLICHAAAQPTGRISAVTTELTHILFVSVWMGVLIQLLLARVSIESATDDASIKLLGDMIRRFSPVALSAGIILLVSGLVLAIRYLCTPAAAATSAYGLTLFVKLVILFPLLCAARFNYRVIGPDLREVPKTLSIDSRPALLQRFGKALELEVTAGLLVIIVAGILASVSPPDHLPNLRLTRPQLQAMASPHLPRMHLPNPASFVGAPERTDADLRYAEFTHNWSGVMVCLLGLGWFAAGLGGRLGTLAQRTWPLLLIPFPIFISLVADPEVWLMRSVTFLQVVRDPQMLEHQIGALLAFSLVALGWLDRRRPAHLRPLGYTLPLLMILGSLLLLGHAHSNFNTSQELTNLINCQHAIFGAFGLFAGIVRWLQLRGLLADRPARLIWPSLVIALGLYMAFCYRETI
jgi:putative copper export protein